MLDHRSSVGSGPTGIHVRCATRRRHAADDEVWVSSTEVSDAEWQAQFSDRGTGNLKAIDGDWCLYVASLP